MKQCLTHEAGYEDMVNLDVVATAGVNFSGGEGKI